MQSSSKVIIILAVLIAFLLFRLWYTQDKGDRALKERYEREIAIQDSIIQVNNTKIDSLNSVLVDLDAEGDSLREAVQEIDKEIIYIEKERDEAHSSIDTTGVSDIYNYWSRELPRYDSILRGK